MLRVEFKPVGVQMKVGELYHMERTELLNVCRFLRNNFREWVWDNFILTYAQRDYLQTMDESTVESLAQAISSALENGEEILLDDQPPPKQSSKMFAAQFPDGSHYLPARKDGVLVIKVEYFS